ncbi:MAG: DUF3854 domain-containing protein [Phormidesmis sp.]
MSLLTSQHLEELKASGISQDILERYFYSLNGVDAQYHLIGSEIDRLAEERDNLPGHAQQYATGAVIKKDRAIARIEQQSEHARAGGWVCSANGQLKPDEPRQAVAKQEDGSYLPVFLKDGSPKLIKYEGIRGGYRGEHISLISPTTEPIKAADGSRLVLITEGGKKAAAAATLGYEAIPLPGVDMGSRKDSYGTTELIPVLAEQVADGATFAIAFDQDSQKSKRRGVAGSLARLAEQLQQAGASVIVPVWAPKAGKGLDDVLMAKGADFVHDAIATADTFSKWKKSLPATWFVPARSPAYKAELARIEKLHAQFLAKPKADITLNQRYLDRGVLGEPGSITLFDSPMSTGKTSSYLAGIMAQHRSQFSSAIGISSAYRNILLRQSGAALGFTHWLDTDGEPSLAKFQYLSACPESLPKLACQDIPPGGLFILDEIVAELKHVFCSDTMKNGADRMVVEKALKTILWKILGGGGWVVGLEAGIPQWAIDCLRELAPAGTPIKLIRNEYKFQANQKAHFYSKATAFKSEQLVMAEKGVRFCAVSDSATQVDKQYREMFDADRSFFISAQNSSEDDAQAFATDPQKFLLDRPNIQTLGFSPTIGAGTSIDEKEGHETFFDAVTGYFTHLTPGAAAQQLARYRRPVPLHVYCPKSGIGIGADDLSKFDPEAIVKEWRSKASYCHDLVNVADYLKQFNDGDLIGTLKRSLDGTQSEVAQIEKWRSIITAIENFEKLHLRDGLQVWLKDRGYEIIELDDPNVPGAADLFKELKENANAKLGAEFAEVEVPDTMSPDEARDILSTHGHTRAESLQAKKCLYQFEFPGCDWDSPEFCGEWLMKNNGKKLSQLRTEWAARNPEAAKAIDRWHLKGKLKQAKNLATGIIAADLSQMSPDADIFHRSGLITAIDAIGAQTYTSDHPEVVKVAEWVNSNKPLLKKVQRMQFEEDRTNVDIFNSFARKLGYAPLVEKKAVKDGGRLKVYCLADFDNPDRAHMLKSLTDKFTAKLEQKGESTDGQSIRPAADWGVAADELAKRVEAQPKPKETKAPMIEAKAPMVITPNKNWEWQTFEDDMIQAQTMAELQEAKRGIPKNVQDAVMAAWGKDGRYQTLLAKVESLKELATC